MLRTRKLDVDQLVTWRQRLLSSLSKLGERDTQKNAIEELLKMIEEMSDQCLPIFMSCLFDTCEAQKQTARREAIRIMGGIAAAHRDIMQPYLAKMVLCIAKHVRDNDTPTRDQCSDTIGVFAKFITPPVKSSGDHPLEVYFKPLFQVLTEQNKNNQTGASNCISKVIENSVGYVTLNLPHLCNRILKHLNHPNFLAQPALLGALSQLVQTAGEYLIPHVPTFLATLLDGLGSGDFPTRKSSAEVLGTMAIRLGPSMIPFRDEILPILDELRFDKVKPVREAAVLSVEAYKSLSGPGNPPLNEERPKTPSRRSTTPSKQRSNSVGSLPIGTSKVVPHTIHSKPPPKFDLSFTSPASSTSTKIPPFQPQQYQYQNLPNQIPEIDSSQDEAGSDDDFPTPKSTSSLPPHRSNTTNGPENGKFAQPHSLALLKGGKQQRHSLPQPLMPHQSQTTQSLPPSIQTSPINSPHTTTQNSYVQQNQPQQQSQNMYSSPNQTSNYSNHPPHNQQDNYSQPNNQSNFSNQSQDLQNQNQQQYQSQNQMQNSQNQSNQSLNNMYNQNQTQQKPSHYFNQPYPPQFSSDNANWNQIAEQLAKLTETQIQFMNKVDAFMFETRKEFGNLSQRMSDMEGIVEILYNNHQARVKEDVFDPLDTLHPPSAEPYDAALGYLGIGHVKAAYDKVIKSGDGLQLARLMQRTGPVVDKLDTPILVELYVRITQFVKTKAFLDTIFPWLWQSISLSNIPLEPPQMSALMAALEDISVDPSKNGIEAAQILAQLKKLGLVWGQ